MPPHRNLETAAFWDGCAAGRLVLPRCDECGELIWYPRRMCPFCGSLRRDRHRGQRPRHACTRFTIIRRGAGPFRDVSPYVLAMVQLAEGPIMMTNLVDCDPEAVTVGQAVHVVFEPVRRLRRPHPPLDAAIAERSVTPTSRTSSISTEMSNGSSAIPTAERAPRPASPNTWTSRFEQPSITCGVRLKPGAQFTMPNVLTTRRTWSSEPSSRRAVPSSWIAVEPRRLHRAGEIDGGADLAGDDAAVGAHRAGAGQEQQIAGAHGADVVAGGRERIRELDPELGESLVDGHRRTVRA